MITGPVRARISGGSRLPSKESWPSGGLGAEALESATGASARSGSVVMGTPESNGSILASAFAKAVVPGDGGGVCPVGPGGGDLSSWSSSAVGFLPWSGESDVFAAMATGAACGASV